MGCTDDQRALVQRLVDSYGYTFGDLTSATIRKNDPQALFELLCLSLLAAPRSGGWSPWAAIAGLKEGGIATPERLACSTWKRKVRVLSQANFRSPERTALVLTSVAETVRHRWGGDLGALRQEAGRDPAGERALLNEMKGMNDARVDLFFREAQSGWSELFPFADEPVLHAAERLGLPDDVQALAQTVRPEIFPRLVSALGHVERTQIYDVFDDTGPARVIDLGVGARESTRLRGAS